jgi:hypothetical protein
MRRLALTMAAVLAVGTGGWWWARSAAEPAPASRPAGALWRGGLGGGAGAVGGRPAVGLLLPRLPGVTWREATALEGRWVVYWTAPSRPGHRYLVQYLCSGRGRVQVRLQATGRGFAQVADCPTNLRTILVVATGDRVGVVVRRLDRRPVEVAAQIVALRTGATASGPARAAGSGLPGSTAIVSLPWPASPGRPGSPRPG